MNAPVHQPCAANESVLPPAHFLAYLRQDVRDVDYVLRDAPTVVDEVTPDLYSYCLDLLNGRTRRGTVR